MEKVKVKISGGARISVYTTVEMTREQFDSLNRELGSVSGGIAVQDILMDFADIARNGNFDDLDLDEFRIIEGNHDHID